MKSKLVLLIALFITSVSAFALGPHNEVKPKLKSIQSDADFEADRDRRGRNRIRIGDHVLNVERDSVLAEVVAKENDGDFVLKFLEGPLRGRVGGNWSRQSLARTRGCARSFCVGDLVINTKRDSVETRVVGVQRGDKYVLEFLEGPLRGKKGANWASADLAKLGGCGESYCVGDISYNVKRDSAKVEVYAVQGDGRYILKFLEGSLAGKKGGNWSEEDLANTQRCGDSFCPGDFAINTARSYVEVKILAVQTTGKYVVEFLEGSLRGKKGANWADKDLARVD